MTATVLPEDLVDDLKPSYTVPAIAVLCHSDCPANGDIYEVCLGLLPSSPAGFPFTLDADGRRLGCKAAL